MSDIYMKLYESTQTITSKHMIVTTLNILEHGICTL